MSLTARDIAEIANLLDSSNFSSLDLTMGELKLHIRRDGGWTSGDDEDRAPAQAGASGEEERGPRLRGDSGANEQGPPIGQEAGAPRVGEVDVPAPLLGNFYAAPRPGDPPFVQPGDAVDAESVIGIIEVMKLMNPIRAGVTGTVVAVLAENGSAVEEGQPLLRVRLKG